MIVTREMERDAAAFVRWEERAAIIEFDGRTGRKAAEQAASRELRFTPRPRSVSIIVTLEQRMPTDPALHRK